MISRRRALALSIRALDLQIRDLAPLANMHDLYKADVPSCVTASRLRRLLREAIAVIEELGTES